MTDDMWTPATMVSVSPRRLGRHQQGQKTLQSEHIRQNMAPVGVLGGRRLLKEATVWVITPAGPGFCTNLLHMGIRTRSDCQMVFTWKTLHKSTWMDGLQQVYWQK